MRVPLGQVPWQNNTMALNGSLEETFSFTADDLYI